MDYNTKIQIYQDTKTKTYNIKNTKNTTGAKTRSEIRAQTHNVKEITIMTANEYNRLMETLEAGRPISARSAAELRQLEYDDMAKAKALKAKGRRAEAAYFRENAGLIRAALKNADIRQEAVAVEPVFERIA